jgi:repressor LexA
MMIGERIKVLRKDKGLSQAALAFRLGLTQQAVYKWEAGLSSPDYPMLVKLALALEIEPERLFSPAESPRALRDVRRRMDEMDIRPYLPAEQKLVPVLGTVRAGYGLPAEEEAQGLEPAAVSDPSRYFYLVVQGDSMEPGIRDQDLALIRKQSALDDGDLGVVIYGDGEGTIKRFHRKGQTVALQAFNPAYETVILSGEDLETLVIIGKVIETKTRW